MELSIKVLGYAITHVFFFSGGSCVVIVKGWLKQFNFALDSPACTLRGRSDDFVVRAFLALLFGSDNTFADGFVEQAEGGETGVVSGDAIEPELFVLGEGFCHGLGDALDCNELNLFLFFCCCPDRYVVVLQWSGFASHWHEHMDAAADFDVDWDVGCGEQRFWRQRIRGGQTFYFIKPSAVWRWIIP